MKLSPSLQAVVRVGAMGAAGKVVLVARDLLIAHRLGLGDSVDAFMTASMVLLFVSSVLTAAIGNAFLPIFIKVREHEGAAAAYELLSRTTGLAALISLVISFGMATSAHPMFLVLAPGFDEPKRQLTVALFHVMTPGLLLCGATLTFTSALYANGRLLIATFGPVANAAVSVLIIAVGLRGHGVGILAWAALAGMLTEAVVLGVACRRYGMPVLPRWPSNSPQLRCVMRQSAPLALASVLSSANMVIDQFMASTLGSGAVASLGYGRKLVQLTIPLATMALSTVYFPRLARLAAANDWAALRSTVRACMRTILVIAVPVTVVLVLVSRPLVRVLFERGSFTAADTDLVTAVQQMCLLQIPFHVGGIVSVRLLSALGRNRIITLITIVNLLVNVVGNLALMRLLGVSGIGLSTSIVFLVSFAQVQFVAWLELNRQSRQVNRE